MLGFSAGWPARRMPALIVAAALAAGFGPGAAAAADSGGALVGHWRILAKSPRGPRVIELKVENKDGRLAGEVGSGANLVPVKEIRAEGEGYVVEYELGRNGRGIAIRMTVALHGDSLTGKAELPAQGIDFGVAGARDGSPEAVVLALAAHALGANDKPEAGRGGGGGNRGSGRGEGRRNGAGRAGASTAPNANASADANAIKEKPANAVSEPKTGGTRIEPVAAERSIAMTEGRDFVGDWTLAIEAQTEAIRRVKLFVNDKAGMLAAVIDAPAPVGAIPIKTIDRTADGLKLGFAINIQSQTFDLEMPLSFENGMLKGRMIDKGGLFELPVRGAPRGQEDLLDSDSTSGANAAVSGRGGAKKGEGFAEATVAGKKISAQFGRPAAGDGAEGNLRMDAPEGTIWPMGREFATRLKTNAAIKTAAGELPPGRYGLWARKTRAGWELLINANPDVWVTQHKDAADLLAVPMTARRLDAPVETMKLALKADGNAAILTVELGSDALEARIELKP